jgi:predicted MFS family arabinose efflux permease
VTAGAPGPASVPTRAIVALSFTAFASAASMRVTDPLLPRFEAEFGVDTATAAYSITAFAIAYGVFQLLFGPAGDHFGKYRVVGWAALASALTTLGCALVPNFGALVVARFFAGAGVAAIIPLSMAWIGDVVSYDRRQPVLARFLTGQILGFASGQLLGGIAADYFGWRMPFVFLAAWFAVAGITLLRIRREVAPAMPTTFVDRRPVVARLLGDARDLARNPWSRVVLLTVFFEGASIFAAVAFLPTHLHRVHGLSLSASGAVAMALGVGGLIFAVISGRIVRSLGEIRLARVGGIIVFIGFATVAFAPAWEFAPVGAALAGLGFYMFHNTLQTNATQMAPERRGTAVAMFASSLFLGQAVGVAVAGEMVGKLGTRPVLLLGGAGVVAVAWVFAWQRHRREEAAAR